MRRCFVSFRLVFTWLHQTSSRSKYKSKIYFITKREVEKNPDVVELWNIEKEAAVILFGLFGAGRVSRAGRFSFPRWHNGPLVEVRRACWSPPCNPGPTRTQGPAAGYRGKLLMTETGGLVEEEVIRHPVLGERWETSVRGGIERRAAGDGPVRHTCWWRYAGF